MQDNKSHKAKYIFVIFNYATIKSLLLTEINNAIKKHNSNY